MSSKKHELIIYKKKHYAEIIRGSLVKKETTFLSPEESSFQFGILAHKKGFKEPPHYHRPFKRTISDLQQMFVVQKGKIRVDYEHNTLPLMLDVKTSKSVSLQGFRKEYGTYDYALQMAYYFDNLKKFRDVKEIFILVLKNTPPYTAAVYRIPNSEIEYGRQLYSEGLYRLNISDRLGYAPGAEISAGYNIHTNEIEDQGVMELTTFFKKDFTVVTEN